MPGQIGGGFTRGARKNISQFGPDWLSLAGLMASRPFRFWLVIGLLVSNLAVGILSLFFLRSVNQRYATLFEGSIPVVNSLRTLTRETTRVQRLARRIAEPENGAFWREMVNELQDEKARVLVQGHEISAVPLFSATDHASAIDVASREYDGRIEVYLKLARVGKLAEAGRYNNDILRPAYDSYQLKLDAAADFVEAQGNSLKERYSKDSRYFGGLLLAFAGWPVLAAALAVLVLGLLIITLLVTIITPEIGWNKRVPRAGPGR